MRNALSPINPVWILALALAETTLGRLFL